MEFSMAKTKYPDLMFQMTEQMAKDLSKLHLGRGMDLNYDASHYGSTLISIAPLIADECREREKEERAGKMTTNTAVADHRK